ncbi:MAG: NUDIX domain-containing protein [Verrucomicrobia bacterium]|nr:NUDIX domain-containing protein [Verrucomicrobiota bacterium]
MSEKPFRLAVRAVIRDEQGRCLLLRRSPVNKGFVGQWEWPGGKADPGEAFDEALCREVREETGLEIELLGVVGAFDFEMPQVRVAMLCMEAKLAGGTLRLSEEHDAHEWVPAAEVPNRNLVPRLKELAAIYAEKGAKQHEH